MNNAIPIFNYHKITPRNFNNALQNDPYTIFLEDFEAQLQLIKDLNFRVINLNELVACLYKQTPLPKNALAITFDDGYQTDYQFAAPALQKMNFTATFFLALMNLDRKTRWFEYEQLLQQGFAVGSHTVNHPNLTKMPPDQAQNELKQSKQTIENHLNAQIDHFALPYGLFNEKIIEIAKKTGYQSVSNTQFGFNNINTSPFYLKRWNIKKSTSLQEIKNVLTQKPLELYKKQILYTIKNTFFK